MKKQCIISNLLLFFLNGWGYHPVAFDLVFKNSYSQFEHSQKEPSCTMPRDFQTRSPGYQCNTYNPALTPFCNPKACRDWQEHDYWQALLILFGKKYPIHETVILPPEFKIFCITSEYHFYIHDKDRRSFLAQAKLYDFSGFWECIKNFPDYPLWICDLASQLNSQAKIKKKFSKKALEKIESEYQKIKKIEIAHKKILEDAHEKELFKQQVFTTFGTQIDLCLQKGDSYKELNTTFKEYGLGDCTRIAQRLDAIEYIKNNDMQYTVQSYQLNQNATDYFKYKNIRKFTQCYGNQLQHTIHQECVDILNNTFSLTPQSPIWEYKKSLIVFMDAACDYNQMGLTNKAMDITDTCWTFFDYSKAILEGTAEGLISAVQDMAEHPANTVLCAVAGEYVLAYQLSKVLYNVADIGLTALVDTQKATEQWQEYIAPVNNLIDAISNKEISLKQGAQKVTKFAVELKVQNKVLGGLGNLFKVSKNRAIEFFKNNPEVSPENYMATHEGILLKISHKIHDNENSIEKNMSLIENFAHNGTQYDKLKGAHVPAKTQAHGLYQEGDHSLKSRGRKDPAPMNGQEALDKSILYKIKGNNNNQRRLSYENDNFVVIDQTLERADGVKIFHGHVRSWDKLEEAMKTFLTGQKLTDSKGKVLDKWK